MCSSCWSQASRWAPLRCACRSFPQWFCSGTHARKTCARLFACSTRSHSTRASSSCPTRVPAPPTRARSSGGWPPRRREHEGEREQWRALLFLALGAVGERHGNVGRWSQSGCWLASSYNNSSSESFLSSATTSHTSLCFSCVSLFAARATSTNICFAHSAQLYYNYRTLRGIRQTK